METKIGKGIYYDPNNITDKYFFGGFFNLADNNIKAAIAEFEEKLSLRSTSNRISEKIETYFSDLVSLADWEKRVKLLSEYLPIVELMDYRVEGVPVAKTFREELKLYFKYIEEYRNYYTHYYHKSISVQESFFENLDRYILMIAKKERKLRGSRTQHSKLKLTFEKELLGKNDDECFSEIEKAFSLIINNKLIKKTITLKDGKSKEIEQETDILEQRYVSKDGSQISKNGLLFLLCSALNRKEAVTLLSNIKGYKSTSELKFMATRWVFTNACFKGLKKTIRSHYSDEALLMQIIDELSKCPYEMYDYLSKENQDQFLYDINEYEKQNSSTEEEGETVIHPVIRKRYPDLKGRSKFVYFALRFLDTQVDFPTLRFQVRAGNYLHQHGSKNLKGTLIEADRIVKEKINFFAKLDEVTKAKATYFEDFTNIKLADSNNDDGTINDNTVINEAHYANEWELFPFPSYNLMDNNIPIYLDIPGLNDLTTKETIENRKGDKPSKADIIEKVFKDIPLKHIGKPVLILSVHEMPSLLYEVIVNKKSGKEIEDILANKILDHIHKLKDVKSYTTNKDEIPKVLQQQNKSDVFNIIKLKSNIKKQQDEIKSKKKAVETIKQEKDSKKIRRYFSKKEMGDIGVELSNEIKNFFSTQSRSNWKGYQHAELQYLIAFFQQKNKDIVLLLNSILPKPKERTFRENKIIELVKKSADLMSFYLGFLDLKSSFLVFLKKKVDDLEKGNDLEKLTARNELFGVFDHRLFIDRKKESLIREILRHPINLNRGIFDDKPTVIQKDNFKGIDENFAAWYLHAKSQNDKMQAFYDYDLVFNDEDNKRKKSDVIQKINRVKIHDVYSAMIAKSLFKSIFNLDIDVDLQTIYLSYEDRKKLEKDALAQKDRAAGDRSENIIKADQLWNTPIRMKILEDRIYDDGVMIRDIGKFRELELDDRVKAILSYNERSWERNEMLNEIQSYELVRRSEVLKKVQELEQSILLSKGWNEGDAHPDILNHNGKSNGFPNFRKYIVASNYFNDLPEVDKEVLNKQITSLTSDDLNSLSIDGKAAYLCIIIRNKFAHNQMLPKCDFDLLNSLRLFEKKGDQSFSEYVYLCFESLIKRINSSY